MDERTIVCVFAKPPVPGAVKTRLASAIGDDQAARLARAFLDDTLRSVRALPWARPILATTGDAQDFSGHDVEVWDQGAGDLGERLERVLRRALRIAPSGIAIGADTPGLPARLLKEARVALGDCDATLGPSDDGGFYLLGLRRCPIDLLRDLPWSATDTFERTRSRLAKERLRAHVLPGWFDVDRPKDLDRLRMLVDHGEISAPATARVLASSESTCR